MKILLEQDDIDADKPSESGETPLWWAALNGHEGVVEMILGRDDVNPEDLPLPARHKVVGCISLSLLFTTILTVCLICLTTAAAP